MDESSAQLARPTDAVGRALYGLSRQLALIGGCLLVLCGLVTTTSILTHALFDRPIRGEFDLVTVGTSWSIYLFLPWCQITRGNIVVDFFFSGASERTRHFLDALGSLLFAAVAGLLVWRMSVGMLEVHESGQSSAVLSIPEAWSFPVALFCLGLLALTSLYTFWRSAREVRP